MRSLPWIAVICWSLPPGPALAAERPIYRCETPTGIVFGDRPCDSVGEPYSPDLSAVSVMTTVPAAPVKVQPAPVRKATAATKDTRAETCARIERSLRQVASTLRAGYTARQGERLKERKRSLDEQRRANRC